MMTKTTIGKNDEDQKKTLLLSDIDNISTQGGQGQQQEEDFSSWMEGLGSSWPKYPKKKKKQEKESPNEEEIVEDTNGMIKNDEIKEPTPSAPHTTRQQQPDFQNNNKAFRNINVLSDAADIFASATSTNDNNIEDRY